MNCIVCHSPALKINIVTGAVVQNWCDEHIEYIKAAALVDLGEDIFNFMFSEPRMSMWFWATDIGNSLSIIFDKYLNCVSREAHGVGHDDTLIGVMSDWVKLTKVKANEYKGAVDVLELGVQQNASLITTWLSLGYVNEIKGPLSKETVKIVEKKRNLPIRHETLHHLVCIALCAKRVERYAGHEFEEYLIGMETALWETHMQQIG